MKTKNKLLSLLILVIIAITATSKTVSAQQYNISFQVFYDQLSPYGQWVVNPDYGNVWIPNAGPDFAPYSTGGYWIMTDYGWTWLSDYSWGWAPFHYGRWSFDNSYGWFWVPDYEWGPAWVNWRGSEGYYGWSPMEPGVSISVSFGMGYNSHYDHWNFVSYRNFGRSGINRYYVSRDDHDRIIRNSTVINNTYIDNSRHTTYVTGPSRDDVQRVSGRKVRPVTIQESNIPEQKVRRGNLHIYRPQGTGNSSSEKFVVPSGAVNRKESERSSDRTDINKKPVVNPVIDRRGDQQPNAVNNQPKNEAVPRRSENVNQPQVNEIEKQPNTAAPSGNRSNFNNTNKNNDVSKNISNIKSNDRNNFNNKVKSNHVNRDTRVKARQQKEASPSQKTVTDKQSNSTKQSNKTIRQSQRRTKSEEEKK